MLPFRLLSLRNVRTGSIWLNPKLCSNKGGGERPPEDLENIDSKDEHSIEGKSEKINSKSSSKTRHKAAKSALQNQNTETKSQEANFKLNELLKLMLEEESVRKTQTDLPLARPRQKKKEKPAPIPAEYKSLGIGIIKAVEEVATSLSGDVKQTQAELLQQMSKATISETATNEIKAPDVQTVKAAEEKRAPKQPINLSKLIAEMKVEHQKPAGSVRSSRSHQVRQILSSQAMRSEGQSVSDTMLRSKHIPRHQSDVATRAGLNEGAPFGFFSQTKSEEMMEVQDMPPSDTLDVWRQQQRQELILTVTHPPANYFEEMILWTNQGKVWKFPIDNEIGMEEESNVPFSEHIFLERHIEDWCPKKGPIRHFMELVCVGLSKNPYMTVEQKKEHINWYRDYFVEKQTLLKEIGALS